MSKSFKGGVLLIIAGVFLLLNQVGVIPGQAFMFLLAFGFIATYVLLGARKEYGNVGFLIPGTVLSAIALYAAISEVSGFETISPAYFFLGLSLSFWVVFLVHTFWFKSEDHGARFWPVYPAAGLLLFSGLISFVDERAEYLNLLNYLWVIVLIAVGGWLVYSSFKQKLNSRGA